MIWLMLACASPPPCSATGTFQGEPWSVRWRGACDPEVGSAIQERLDDLEARLGVWSTDGELLGLRGAGRTPVGEELYSLLRTALDLAAASRGAFDPTVEPLLEAYGFHRAEPREPTADELAAALDRVGWQRVALGRDDAGHPWVDVGDTALDLSAVLEGHAADRVSALLGDRGIGDHLVSIDGELRASGGPWTVAAGDTDATVIRLVGGLSGTAPHAATLDPRTGRTAPSTAVHVAVRAPTAREADGLATAAAVLGPEAGIALLAARPGVEGRIDTADGPRTTPGWPGDAAVNPSD